MNFDFLNRGAMLAPMAGVTDMPFRVLCHEMGCPMAVSEMVSAKGYLLAPKDNRATRELLSVDERERGAVALQLFGHEPEIMARAAEELTRGGRYALLDINMGCPVPKIVGNGEGSALMKEPVRAAEIVAAVAKASHVPVTVKMRLGFEAGSETYLLLGQLAQDYAARAHEKPVLRRPRRLERHREAQAARVHPRGRQRRRDLLAGRAADARGDGLRRRGGRPRGAGQPVDFPADCRRDGRKGCCRADERGEV